MSDWVDVLAQRTAGWPAESIALCKQSINNAELDIQQGLREESYLFQQTLRNASAQRNMQKALDLGAQTREGEPRMGELCSEVADSVKPTEDEHR